MRPKLTGGGALAKCEVCGVCGLVFQNHDDAMLDNCRDRALKMVNRIHSYFKEDTIRTKTITEIQWDDFRRKPLV